jgi:hypothetical protein
MVDNKLQQMAPPEIDLDSYLDSLRRLLESRKAQDLVIGLVGATGRLYDDMTGMGQFIPQDHPYVIQFSGTLQAADCCYDMLTLLPATEVLLAIHQLRKQPEMIAIAGQGAEDKRVQRFNRYTNRATHRLMGESGLVPLQKGSKSITLQRLQEIYGAIAVHYFCPEHRREQGFLDHYLTPVLSAMGRTSSPKDAAELDFKCVLTREGQPLRARGIKVPSVGLPPIPDSPKGAIPEEAIPEEASTRASGSNRSNTSSAIADEAAFSDTSDTADTSEILTPSTPKPDTDSQPTVSAKTMVAPRKRSSAKSRQTSQPVAAAESSPSAEASEKTSGEASATGSQAGSETPLGEAAIASPPSTPVSSGTPTKTYTTNISPELVATLQRIAEQQSGTIATQAETVARLQSRLEQLESRLAQPAPGVSQASPRSAIAAADPAQVQTLKQALTAEQQTRAQLEGHVSHYRQQWLKTLDHLNQIRNAMRMPPIAIAAEDDPIAPATEASSRDVPARTPGGDPQQNGLP